MKVLFLSHSPHEVHLNFSKEVQSRIKILPFDKFVQMTKIYPFLGYIYPLISLIYSFFIKTNENILFVDGGSSLYLAAFLKLRYRNIKIIYLDSDLLFYDLRNRSRIIKKIIMFFIKKIDGVISVSIKNKKYISQFLNVPIEICNPYPRNVKKKKIARKNYGLYVGRLEPDKNIKRIIDFGLKCPYFEKFIVLGDGALKSHVRAISKKSDKICFVDKTPDVEKYYNQCKFLVHIPDYDPFPCTTMEAALCGCFPIISKEVGTSKLFDNMFVVSDPDNYDEINRKVKYIISHERQAAKSLKNTTSKIPNKEQSLKYFRNAFQDIMRKIQ